jgi:hypothetical protein
MLRYFLVLPGIIFCFFAGLSDSPARAADNTTVGVIVACSDNKTGAIRIVPNLLKCTANETGLKWNTVGPAGPRGVEGPKGAMGLRGLMGLKGPMGLKGATGAMGPKGATGAVGPKGATGLAGIKGDTGPIGPKGATGVRGPQGPGAQVADAAGNTLGMLIGHEVPGSDSGLQAAQGQTLQIFIPQLNKTILLDKGTGNAVTSCPELYYTTSDCSGSAYSLCTSDVIFSAVDNTYRFIPSGPTTNMYSGSMLTAAGCSSFGGMMDLRLTTQVTTTQLPFTLPVALPLKYKPYP